MAKKQISKTNKESVENKSPPRIVACNGRLLLRPIPPTMKPGALILQNRNSFIYEIIDGASGCEFGNIFNGNHVIADFVTPIVVNDETLFYCKQEDVIYVLLRGNV